MFDLLDCYVLVCFMLEEVKCKKSAVPQYSCLNLKSFLRSGITYRTRRKIDHSIN